MPLKKLFGSRLRADLLSVFYLSGLSVFHVRQLAEMVDGHSTNVSREVRSLVEQGILLAEIEGRKKVLRLAKGDRIVEALRQLIKAGADPIARLQRGIEGWGQRLLEPHPVDAEGKEVLVMVQGENRPLDLDALVQTINEAGLRPQLKVQWVYAPPQPSSS
ncbi:winged helix-turn-helix transcriptional regulator [bacterium]|nr:winged helix-turn-helix transcriptional regulator [bacterium]